MWKKQNTYFEQPDVQFKNELVLSVLDSKGNSKMFSTVKDINRESLNEMGVPLIRMNQEDTDADGLIDKFNLKIEFKSIP